MQIVTAYSVSNCIYNKINLIVPEERARQYIKYTCTEYFYGERPKSIIKVKTIIKLCDFSNFYVTKNKKTSKPFMHTISHALHNSNGVPKPADLQVLARHTRYYRTSSAMAISCAPFILDKWVASLGYDNYMQRNGLNPIVFMNGPN